MSVVSIRCPDCLGAWPGGSFEKIARSCELEGCPVREDYEKINQAQGNHSIGKNDVEAWANPDEHEDPIGDALSRAIEEGDHDLARALFDLY